MYAIRRYFDNVTMTRALIFLACRKAELVRILHEDGVFADSFLSFLLRRSLRTQADLVDQLFNSSEKRLARILLLMAGFGKDGQPETLIPKISQEALAEMVGTTRSRVSFFMNRFREHGFIDYDGRITVHQSLLALVLHDQAFENKAISPVIVEPPDPVRASRRRRTGPARDVASS